MDDTPIREASVIVAPPDTCPNCQQVHNPATHTRLASNGELCGFYYCPGCGFMWDTTWRIEPR